MINPEIYEKSMHQILRERTNSLAMQNRWQEANRSALFDPTSELSRIQTIKEATLTQEK